VVTLLKINRRDWLALQAQKHRRARLHRLLPAPVALITNLMAYWKLDEGGDITRLDSHINGAHLWQWSPWGGIGVYESPVWQTSGVVGSAALFDPNYDTALLAPGAFAWDGMADFSISGWINYSAGWDGIFTMLEFTGILSLRLDLHLNAFQFWAATAASDFLISTGDYSLIPANWNHVAVVREGGTVKVYLNGTLAGSGAITSPLVSTDWITPADVVLGSSAFGTPIPGALDEFGVWQRALSAAEVGQLYNSGNGLTYEDL
jgi:hypothetical protein